MPNRRSSMTLPPPPPRVVLRAALGAGAAEPFPEGPEAHTRGVLAAVRSRLFADSRVVLVVVVRTRIAV